MIAYLLLLSVCSILIPSYEAEEACSLILDKYNRAEMMSRNCIFGSSNLWPNRQVPYIFGYSFTSNEKNLIRKAMDTIESKSCVKFVPRSRQRNFIQFRNRRGGCFASAVGFNRFRARTIVNLDRRGCMGQTIIIHELYHVLGFLHEQNRPDRDQFIRVSWSNIRPTLTLYYQFARARSSGESIALCNVLRITPHNNCYNGVTATTLGLPYDYGSIMQYTRKAFTKNGRDTMTPLKGDNVLGTRTGMSSLDVQKLNKAYPCKGEKSCEDQYGFCSPYKRYCSRSSFMRINCKKTCNLCS